MLTNLYPYEKYPNSDSPWTIPYFTREWVASGHAVVTIVNSTRFPRIYYKFANCAKRFLIKKYNITGKSLSDTSWTKSFEFNDKGVRVFNRPMMKFVPSGKYSHYEIRRQISLIKKILEKENFKPDIITGHWANPQFILISELKRIYNCKTCFVFEGDYWSKYIKKYSLKKYVSNIDIIGCRSKTAAKSVKESLKLEYMPFICASGIPDEYIIRGRNKCIQKCDNNIMILSAGRLVRLKHFDAVIKACHFAFNQNYILKIAGEGELFSELINYSKEIEADSNTMFLGKIPRDELIKEMANNHVFVLISDHEAFGIVYIEAMSQGCIVIASRNGGIDGIIIDGKNGFLCEEGNSEELEILLKRIMKMKNSDKEIIINNALKTAENYSNKKVAERYLNDMVNITI